MKSTVRTRKNVLAPTTVVNLRLEPYDVYIGRTSSGAGGYFGNPFSIIHGDRRDAIQKFRAYFFLRLKEDPEYRKEVMALRGKRLGCFCKPRRCHGDIIAEYVNSQTE